jgi:hypothetical protein
MTPDIAPVQHVLQTWTAVGQALVGSIGALAFVFAFLWKMTSVDAHSVTQAKQWIQRIVVGTLGVEMAGTLIQLLTGTLPNH